MIRIALVEDDAYYREELVALLKRYEQESSRKLRITVFTDGDEIVEGYQADYDIILMDIEMQFMDGMSAAEHIRAVDSEVGIIFITNMPQYAMKGYKVEALDYVLKPITYFAFTQRIERALERMKRRAQKYISIPIKGGIQKLEIARITYIEVRNHDLVFHTRDGDYLSKGTLATLEEKLAPEHFFRCNKCYLVNLEHVESVRNNDITVGSDLILVSRARKKALLDALNNYLNEVGK